MQRAIVIFIVLIAVIAALSFAFGVFEPSETPPSNGDDTPTNGTSDNGDGIGLAPTTPKERPETELLDLAKPSKVLFIAKRKGTANKHMTDQWMSIPQLMYQSWYLFDQSSSQQIVHGMEPLTSAPTAAHLGAEQFNLLVLDNFDPAALPDTFWNKVKERVQNGSMGLVLFAHVPIREDGEKPEPMLDHPFLTHSIVKTLVPIAEASQFKGDPNTGRVPGTFRQRRPFKITSEGEKHIATRMTEWPKWSRVIWEEWGEGKGALTTLFCYPVTEMAPGAHVLLTVDGGGDPDVPVVVIGDEKQGRVMWIGTPEWSWEAHYDSSKADRMSTIVRNFTVWGAGAAK